MTKGKATNTHTGAQAGADFPAGGGEAFPLADLLDCLGRWARGAQFSHGLNPAQWEGLRFLGRANRLSRTPGALAKYLGTTRGTASQTVLALEKKGYLTRMPDKEDRRVVYLDLSEAGRKILREDPLRRLDRTLKAAMDPETVPQISRNLHHVMECFQSAALGQTFGTCEKCGHLLVNTGSGQWKCGLEKVDLNGEDASGICVNFAPRQVAAVHS